ncbi:molybdenum ABC transporter ATP-binding protein [Celeribacter marinus]|uniref:Molybdenum transport ATP-binding protein ModC n=1 Tax=Celeribacter marinus TaxID=1397108 RepID=A0A0N9ZGP4_9RHOB|nr:molybdenum ABC transporter ATP-binding protein [Celeribacter marinus]ALI54961.1 molybdenum transport ATP-binding protein ModC [Celeribacter marinus]SFK03150.1 molybdate transport system ATP-binding protein [Celeribacter marinus]
MSLSVCVKHAFDGFAMDVDFTAPKGITVLFGRSGAGKSTIIDAVAGLQRPNAGRIVLDGEVLLDTRAGVLVPVHKRRIGYIFQDARLFPHLTVAGNLAYGQRLNRRADDAAQMSRVVELLGISDLLDRRPARLSGGERQRVAIGRALLSRPRLLLADEPLAALDEARKAEIIPYFERLRDEVDIPILYVSHAPTEVARLATTVVALEGGRVIRQGEALDVLSDPSVLPTGVRGAGAVIEARVIAHHEDGLSELDAGGVPLFLPHVSRDLGLMMRVRIAAQDVILSRDVPVGLSALNIMAGEIVAVKRGDGPGAIVSLKTSAGPILARVTQRSADALGLVVGVHCHAIIKTVSIAPEDAGA